MNIYFGLSFISVVLLQMYYLHILCKTPIFQRRGDISGNKKVCIQELHRNKDNTPTMGGLAMAGSLLLMTCIYLIVEHHFFGLSLFILLYGILGSIDDFIKIKEIRDGLTSGQKMFGILLISSGAVWYMSSNGLIQETVVHIPFFNVSLQMNGFWYFVFLVFLLALSTNGLNITDGLDGLAVGIAIIAFTVIGIIAYQMQVPDVMFGCMVLGAGCAATFWFNKYPARLFMGDTGSLLLGGAIGLFLIRLGLDLWIPMILGVCMFEVLSDVIQIIAIRIFDRRVFLIAPFHHHLEKKGWKETTIVYVFWAGTVLCGLLAYFAYRWS